MASTLDDMELDPDDPRPPYLQVAHQLRAAILTGKLSPGEKLPSGPELAKSYGVARQTILQAIRELRESGLIVSRQGSGVFVRSRASQPIGLRARIENAFKRPDVRIDFAGLSGETLHQAIQGPLNSIREGKYAPDSLHIRLLMPDASRPWALPCRADNLEDEPLFRKRALGLITSHARGIAESVSELEDLGLIASASAEIRSSGEPSKFKLYVINREEALFGFYAVSEHAVTLDNGSQTMFDLMGKDTELMIFSSPNNEDESLSSQFVEQAQAWFDAVWTTIGRES